MDADGALVQKSIPNFVHITQPRGDELNVSRQQIQLQSRRHPPAIGHARVGLTLLRPHQHTNETPNGVVVNGGGLTGAPHKTHHTKALFGVKVQQILLIMNGMGLTQR